VPTRSSPAGWDWISASWDEWIASKAYEGIKDLSILPREITYGGMYFNIGFLLLAPHVLRLCRESSADRGRSEHDRLEVDRYPALCHPPKTNWGVALVMNGIPPRFAMAYLHHRRADHRLGLFDPAPPASWSVLAAWQAPDSSVILGKSPITARFVAVDALLMQFRLLDVLLITQALSRRDPPGSAGWLLLVHCRGFGSDAR